MPEELLSELDVVVENSMGLHARPAAMIVQCAGRFKADVTLEHNGEIVRCDSILGLMVLSAARGSRLRLSAVGEDSAEAVAAIGRLFEEKFGED